MSAYLRHGVGASGVLIMIVCVILLFGFSGAVLQWPITGIQSPILFPESACVWRITDFRHKLAIRHTQASFGCAMAPEKTTLRCVGWIPRRSGAAAGCFGRHPDGDAAPVHVGRPDVFTYSGRPVAGIPRGTAPSVLNTSYTITADIEVPQGGAEGMIVTDGGRFGGYGYIC